MVSLLVWQWCLASRLRLPLGLDLHLPQTATKSQVCLLQPRPFDTFLTAQIGRAYEMHTENTRTHSSSNTKKRRWFWTVEVCLHLHLPLLNNIKLPHICIPKAYTYLHLFSSHLGYVVKKCYDFRITACCFRLFGDHSVRKNSLHVSTAVSCQW